MYCNKNIHKRLWLRNNFEQDSIFDQLLWKQVKLRLAEAKLELVIFFLNNNKVKVKWIAKWPFVWNKKDAKAVTKFNICQKR